MKNSFAVDESAAFPSLYVHIPFCERKCLFCSFPITVGQRNRVDEYLTCLESEMRAWQGTRVKTIYLGGGTPTFLDTAQLKRLTGLIRKNFRFSTGIEWTIEANPEGITEEKALSLWDLGINRVSLGIQSFHEKYLKFLGRCHDGRQALRAFEYLRGAGFSNINVDVMFSFPGETLVEIRQDIETVAQLGSEHVSLYALTVEENSRFYAQALEMDEAETQAKQYRFAAQLLEKVGLQQYEISNFARPGKQSQHNLNYWQGGNYIGLGMGAHSHLDGKRWWNVDKFSKYLSCAKDNSSIVADQEHLMPYQQMVERLLLGLRMHEGINLRVLERKFGFPLDRGRKNKIEVLKREGFLKEDENCLKATPQGQLILDELCVRLI